MTRLQKKCLVASASFHGLMAGVFVATAAFRSEPAITEGRVLTLIPTRILDRPGVGGEPVPSAAKPQPSQPATRATPPATPPPPHPADLPKPVARTAPKPPTPSTTAEKPAPEPTRTKPGIKVDLTPVSRSSKPPPKPTESSASAKAAALEASKKRAQEISNVFAALDSTIHSKEPNTKVVALGGEGGGEAFVNYRTAVFNAYYQAWKTPEETARKLALADVKIVVLRDGTIASSEFLNKSGDAAVDRSVQRALDAVKQLPPFPPGAQDAERSFIIRFNLEAKLDAG
jgi:TonB family protein